MIKLELIWTKDCVDVYWINNDSSYSKRFTGTEAQAEALNFMATFLYNRREYLALTGDL